MKPKITSTLYVSIHGCYYKWEELLLEQKKDISAELNKKAMKAIGFVPIPKKNVEWDDFKVE